MRPIKKRGNHPPYSTTKTFSFMGAAAAAIKKVVPGSSGTNVPIADCLDAWLLQVKGQNPKGGTLADQTTAVKAIQSHVGNMYKQASVPLTQELGAFCSFCETPLSSLLEVEHCAPKSEYPIFSLDWENFLLSCSPCNISKGSIPSRTIVQGWLGKTSPTEAEFYDEIRKNRYVWADRESHAYRWLPVKMEYYDSNSGSWQVLQKNQAYNLHNIELSRDIAKREVKARIYDDPTQKTYHDYLVRVVASGTSSRGTEMVKLCKLNEAGKLTSTHDRRVMNRTLAWLRC